MDSTVSVTREIGAPATEVWALVADLPRMGEWSPETDGGKWIGGATGPQPGAKFKGSNSIGRRSWKTVATVLDAEPGSRFSFRVDAAGIKIAEWVFEFESTDGGCRATETWIDRRPGFFMPFARMITGVSDRTSHNRAGIEQTLDRLATAAESGQSPN